MAFYPSVGGEFGHAIVKPATLFDQPVDLSAWGAIARGVVRAVGEIYLLHHHPTADRAYRFTVAISYVVRLPFTDEPFVTAEYRAGQRVQVVQLTKRVRHEVEAAMNWNASDFVGFQLGYKYGSLPPLFTLVDHQLTFGITIKATQKRARPTLH